MNKTININSPVFLIGMPRSGTSIISEAISLHDDLGWISNWVNAFPRCYWLSALNRANSLPVLGAHLRGKKKQKEDISSTLRKFLPYSIEAFPVWEFLCGKKFSYQYLIDSCATEIEKKRVLSYIKNLLFFQGKQRFFSKFTGPPRINFLNSIFERPFFIHVTRDPRAVVSSLLNISFWRENGLQSPWWEGGLPENYILEWIESGKSSAVLAAIQWKRILEISWQEKEIAGEDRYLELKYEDFVKSPHEHLNKIYDFVGLSESKKAHEYLKSVGKMKDMNYKYKENLSEKEIISIERTTRIVARKAGYEF